MSDGCSSGSHVLTLYSWPRVPLLMGFVVPGTGVLHCSRGGRSAFCSFFLLSSKYLNFKYRHAPLTLTLKCSSIGL